MADQRLENSALNLSEYRSGRTFLASRPRFLIVELTQGCNLHCPMCRSERISTKERGMSDAIFERIAGELFATAEMVDLRGWGESLILPDIARRIDEVARQGARIRFVTNLSFRRDEILAVLAEHGCHVAVSVDTADPHLFQDLRGGARLNQVAMNLDRLIQAYKARQGSTEQIYITATVQRPALDTLADLMDFAADHEIREVRLFGVTAPPESRLSIEGRPADVDAALLRCAARARRRGVQLQVGTRLGSMPEKPGDEMHCLHPWAYAYFSYDGRVGFCDHLIGQDGIPYLLGNLNDSTFEEIWNGREWQELRREHLTSRNPHASYFEECGWCYKNRFVDFEHFFLPEAAAKINYL